MRLFDPILRSGGLLVHLGWLAAILALSPMIAVAIEAPLPLMIGAIAAGGLPGLVGVFFARRSAGRFSRLILSLLWVALAAGTAVISGGILGPAAWTFLLPVAAIASFGSRPAILESAALAGSTAVLLLGLQLWGLLPFSLIGLAALMPVYLAAACFVAAGFGLAAARNVRHALRYRRIARRHRRQSKAFENAPLPIIISQGNNILVASKATHVMLPGLPPDLSGLPLKDLAFSDVDRTGFEFHLKAEPQMANIRGLDGVAQSVHVLQADSGVTALFPTDPNGSGAAERRRLVKERDQARLEAKAKSEFLASVSHEIRTPLNAIIGFSDAMKSRLFGPVPAKYAEYAELIHESGLHLLELVGDVLDLSKIEAESYQLALEKFEARDVIQLCVRMLSQRADQAKVTLELALDDEMPVKADRKALRQILLNLLSNAIKFTPDGGVIVVMAHAEGDQLVLAVGDSGPGIPETELKQLGQRYQQASTARESSERGSGLGLSLVKALAEMHGGEMKIASTVGEGTTVSVSMPILSPISETHEPDAPLEVHSRIERAQTVGQSIVSASGR